MCSLRHHYPIHVVTASLTGDSGAPEVNDACLRAWRAHTDYGEGLADPAAAALYRASTSSPPAAAATAAAAAAAASAASSSSTSTTITTEAAASDNEEGKQQVAWFWEALAGLAPTERAMVWRFATGKRYPPRDAAGFAAMDPLFTLVGSTASSSATSTSSSSSATDSSTSSTRRSSRRSSKKSSRYSFTSAGNGTSASPGSSSGPVPGLGSIRAATCFHQLQLPPAPGFTSAMALRHALLESAAEANAAANLALSSEATSGGGGDGAEEAIFDDSFAAHTRRLQAAVARAAAEAGASISASSSSSNTGKDLGSLEAAKLRAELRKEFPNSHQCKACGCGPVEHAACADLKTHHGDVNGKGFKVNNACPQCGWFSPKIEDWPPWDGHVRMD